ncbi:unnamed protein product [Oppiella nova]|uniref:Uncharacterized protein n=1 Tax=Oppiella nova TaxID=334625 RepID=A0A7R9LU53_9ACAR|nr:unnamed protein product [Oppiella nova]CAG2167029.1 unnamed protein product [Oppiella nova]
MCTRISTVAKKSRKMLCTFMSSKRHESLYIVNICADIQVNSQYSTEYRILFKVLFELRAMDGNSGGNDLPVRLSLWERILRIVYSKEEWEAYMIEKRRKLRQKEDKNSEYICYTAIAVNVCTNSEYICYTAIAVNVCTNFGRKRELLFPLYRITLELKATNLLLSVKFNA